MVICKVRRETSIERKKLFIVKMKVETYIKGNNSYCRLIKQAMRIAFAISANECNARSIAIQWRQIAPSCGLTFRLSILVSLPPHFWLPFVSCNGVHWSWQHFSPLLSLCPPLRSDNETRLRDMNESFPSPGYIPLGLEVLQVPSPRTSDSRRTGNTAQSTARARSYILQ